VAVGDAFFASGAWVAATFVGAGAAAAAAFLVGLFFAAVRLAGVCFAGLRFAFLLSGAGALAGAAAGPVGDLSSAAGAFATVAFSSVPASICGTAGCVLPVSDALSGSPPWSAPGLGTPASVTDVRSTLRVTSRSASGSPRPVAVLGAGLPTDRSLVANSR